MLIISNGVGGNLDRSHTTLAGLRNHKYLAAQSNIHLPARNLATQLTFRYKDSFSGINCIDKIPFKIMKQCQYF